MSVVEIPKLGPGTLTFSIAGKVTDFTIKTEDVFINPDSSDDAGTPMLNHDEYFADDAKFGEIGGVIAQDYQLSSLEVWTYLNHNKEADYVFIPKTKTGYKASGKCKIKAVKIGGSPKKVNKSDFSFPLVGGLPTFAAAPTA